MRMKNPFIIIINPFHSPLENQIVDSFNSLKLSDYLLIDSLNFDISNIQFCPSLILVLLETTTLII